MPRIERRWLVLLAAVLLCGQALAHESQPGLLELKQLHPSRYQVLWRAPIYYGQPHPARVQLPENWQTVGDPTVRQLPDSALHRRVVEVPGKTIDGSIIRFPGLEATITDVFVRVLRLDGSEASQVVRPFQPFAELRGERPWYVSSGEYLLLGFNHILMGIDHLLFVLGLLIIVQGRGMLIKTVTAFTVAHSITLALATLGYASIPGPPLNAAIALSILFLGPEIVRVWRGQTSFTIRHPWVVAFAFGLLHGFGFASGLSTVGMPKAEIPLALLAFNIGVELGQLVFVLLMLQLLTRLGYLVEEQDMIFMAETETDTALGPLQSAACTYRIAFGPRAGQKVLSLQSVPRDEVQPTDDQRCANAQGFSLHAEVRCAMNQRHQLEQLCRYITRPAIANERLQLNSAGDVVLQLKSQYKDGTTHIVMTPLEFMQRLAALVPRPRLNLIRFHGVLAPNAKLRPQIIPGRVDTANNTSDELDGAPHHASSARMNWARLLKRVFDIDVEHCPHCGGNLKIIAAIEEPRGIAKILAHLGLPTRAPPRSPAQSFDLLETA